MDWKKIIVVILYFIIILLYGYIWGVDNGATEQAKINNQLKKEYDELKQNYDNLETEYKWKLESCYQQIGDMQDDLDVNNDGVINAQDYVVIKNYIMNREEECFINGGWNCE